MKGELLIVYNAPSDLFNKSLGLVHKFVHPKSYQCDLCKLTHGPIQEKKEWTSFLSKLKVDWKYVYKDQFHQENLDFRLEALPAIYFSKNQKLVLLITQQEIGKLDLSQLMKRINQRVLDLHLM